MKNPANLPIDLSDYPPYMNGTQLTLTPNAMKEYYTDKNNFMKNPANLPIDLSDYPPYMNGHSIAIWNSIDLNAKRYERVFKPIRRHITTLIGISITKRFK